MPVKPFVQMRSSSYDELVQALYQEWSQPDPNANEPVILEEAGRDKRLIHVYVIWSRWAHLDGIERSEIIMDAAQKKLDDAALSITIAMGLTPTEALRMGIAGTS